jgi:hypothetical protein
VSRLMDVIIVDISFGRRGKCYNNALTSGKGRISPSQVE